MTTGPWRPDDAGKHSRFGRQGRSVHRAPRLGPRALETAADRQRVNDRVKIIEGGLIALVLLLLLGFWHTQVVHGAHYARLAENNQWRTTRVRPARGLILDRNGEILATNRPSYEVAIVREEVQDQEAVFRWLATTLEEPEEVLRQRMQEQRSIPDFTPVVVASAVPERRVIRLEARRREYPGVIVQVSAQRHYPRGSSAAHILGHVGQINARQLESSADRFRMGDIIGQLGVERVYNDDLAGQAGSKLAVVNSAGREMRVEREDAPLPGETVILTIDIALQEKIEELLGERRGAVVVLDARTGGILAMVSSPAFDPNAFAARFSVEEWERIQADRGKPLQNRALDATLPPGSIFKLVMAAAGLEEGLISTSSTYFCPGGKTLYGRFFRCLGQHGNVNVVQALAYSCNSFFYELGVQLGRQRIVEWAQRFGLGSTTGVDLPDEQGGIVPSDEWLASTGRRYYPGETVSIAIGQGLLAVSPLQLARLAAVATTGFDRRPHLLQRVEQASGGGSQIYLPEAAAASFGERTRDALVRGMSQSVRFGSSQNAFLANLAIGGKTGTAQVASTERVAEENEDRPEHLRNHAWFVGAAPIDDPEITVAVFLQHGGSGGAMAAPLGGRIVAAHFGVPAEQVGIRRIPVTEGAAQGEETAQR